MVLTRLCRVVTHWWHVALRQMLILILILELPTRRHFLTVFIGMLLLRRNLLALLLRYQLLLPGHSRFFQVTSHQIVQVLSLVEVAPARATLTFYAASHDVELFGLDIGDSNTLVIREPAFGELCSLLVTLLLGWSRMLDYILVFIIGR